jgi:cytochrome oxidase assembly protein ShyY1
MKYLESWKRWAVWFLIATLFAVACVFLSQWQFERRSQAVEKIQLIAKNYDRPPVPLDSVSVQDTFDPGLEWLPVEISGRFLSEDTVLVRNRPLNGQPGFLQLIPFELTSGELIAIEAGWLPTGNLSDSPDVNPLPSSEIQTITGRIRPAEPTLGRDAPAGQIATINIESFIEKQDLAEPVIKSFYLRLDKSSINNDLPKALPRPAPNEGNHLSYAFQWILFAVLAFGALWFAVREEIHVRRLALDASYRPKLRKKFGDEDKKIEDEANR